QLLLSGEVRVEELFARHPDAARQEIRDSADGIGDRRRAAVEIELRVGEAADDAIAMAAEVELQLHPHGSAPTGAREADRIAGAARGGIPVDGPRDRFEDRRLPRSIGTNDSREPRVELDAGVRVLPEVGERDVV